MSSDATMTLIGIDCACQPKNVGLARAEWAGGGPPRVTDVLCGAEVPSVAETVADWVRDADRSLLALDAPLGWPALLGPALDAHVAGAVIHEESDRLFRRETDRDIHRRFRKMPLEVGAERIARTARAALQMLDEVRSRTGLEIPLAWSPADTGRASAIEVYPAGTLLAHGFPAAGYKKREQRPVREAILQRLDGVLTLPDDREPMLDDADQLDAAICILAAADFLAGRAIGPTDMSTAKKEGWIWVASGNSSKGSA